MWPGFRNVQSRLRNSYLYLMRAFSIHSLNFERRSQNPRVLIYLFVQLCSKQVKNSILKLSFKLPYILFSGHETVITSIFIIVNLQLIFISSQKINLQYISKANVLNMALVNQLLLNGFISCFWLASFLFCHQL